MKLYMYVVFIMMCRVYEALDDYTQSVFIALLSRRPFDAGRQCQWPWVSLAARPLPLCVG